MWEKALLLSIILLGLISGVKSQKIAQTCDLRSKCKACQDFSDDENMKLRYIMYYLPVMKSGEKGQVCVCLKCKEPVHLKITMEYLNQSIPIYKEKTSNICGCKKFWVPTVETEQLGYITFAAVGPTVEKIERKGVAINVMRPVCLTQSQKLKYQPGEMVECIVFCIDHNLKPVDQNFTKVVMTDPTGARLAEITQPTSRHGLCLAKFNISTDASDGYYMIEFRRDTLDPVTAYIKVEQYLPSRFDSTLMCPIGLSVLERSSEVTVSAQYVYGGPVPGSVIGKCCRKVRYAYGTDANCLRGLEDLCTEFTAELNSTTGNHTEKLDLSGFKLQISQYDNNIQCEVTTKEAGTEVLVTKSCYIPVTSQPANLRFDYNYYHQYYKTCIPYLIVAQLTNEKGEGMANEFINIEVNGEVVKNATTDAQGRISCEIDTSSFRSANITVTASYRNENQCYSTNQQVPTPWLYDRFSPYPYPSYRPYPYDDMIVYRFYSESNCFLQITSIRGKLPCNKTYDIEVKYKVTEAGVGKGATEMTVHHMVRVRDEIVSHGQQQVTLTKCLSGSFYIPMLITPEFAINPEIMVMAMMSKEIISDKHNFEVETCFHNEVHLTYTEPVVAPGSVVHLNLSAAPNSFCAIKTSDSSLRYIDAQSTISADQILYSLPMNYFGNYNFDDPPPPCVDPNKEVFCCGGYYRPVSSPTDGDTYSNFKGLGCVVSTNLNVRKQVVCGMEEVIYPLRRTTFADGIAQSSLKSVPESGPQSDSGGVIETKRSKLNDILPFKITITGSEGSGTAKYTIPESITEWESEMICFSKKEGLGLTKEPAKVITMLPVFVDVTMAVNCIKGERIVVVGTAVNNLDKCIKVNLTIEGSHFNATPLADDSKTCICKGERTFMKWSVEFFKIGEAPVTVTVATTQISNSCDGPNDESERPRKDSVVKNVTVEPEGVPTEMTYSYLTRLNGSTVTFTVPIQEQPNAVPDSCSLYYVVVGDMIGLAAENMENLLLLPDGCCEQSMGATIAAVLIANYLKATGQLTDTLEERAKYFFTRQYARQLACRPYNGGISIFRGTFVPNSWLEMYMIWCLYLLSGHVYVDENIMLVSLQRLSELQDPKTGCLSPIGRYFTAQDQDEKNAQWHMTACVAIRLKEIKYSNGVPLLEGAKRCLQAANPSEMDMYTLALAYHAAAVNGLPMLHDLHSRVLETVVSQGGIAYWQIIKSPPAPGQPCRSADADITAHIIRGLLMGPEEYKDHELIARGIAYLSRCMNKRGGLSSSVDSVSAMQVLAEYGKEIYTNGTNCEVSMSQENNEVARIRVTQNNKMVVRREALPAVFKTVTISASGVGYPLVQVTQKCNVRPNENSSLSLNVTTRAKTCTDGVAAVIDMDVCYSNKDIRTTNMLLLNMKILTGFEVDRGLAIKLKSPEQIGEIQLQGKSLQCYLMPLKPQEGYCFTVTTYMGPMCLAYKEETATLKDYYSPVNSVSATYSHPCFSSAKE